MFRLLARPFASRILLFFFIIPGWARDQCVAGASQHNIFGSLDTLVASWPRLAASPFFMSIRAAICLASVRHQI